VIKNDIINSIISSNLNLEYLFIAEQFIEKAAYILDGMSIEMLAGKLYIPGIFRI
jgi:hypothetical protein